MKHNHWNTTYEWKAVLLLSLGFGLVGLDRWIIAPLLPEMMQDLHFNYQDVGMIFGTLGIMWGICAIISGRLSDSIGHRKVLIPSILIFSLASGLTGMATGFVGLILIRALMGVSEGTFCPTSFAAVAAAAKPSRRGSLQGLQQSGFALFGLGLGPIIATQLLLVVPSWRSVFWLVAIPGLIVGIFMYYIIKEPEHTQGSAEFKAHSAHPTHQANVNWSKILKERNILLCMVALFCVMSCAFVISAMVPLYLEHGLKLDAQTMGIVVSAIGFGGFAGQFLVPAISDMIGRKITTFMAFVGASLFVWLFSESGAQELQLFIYLFILSFFSLGNIGLLTGPIATESAPQGLVASSIGLVVGAGEIFGGGIAPFISGFFAEHYGIKSVLYVALAGVLLGCIVSLFIQETAPIKQKSTSPSA